MKVSEYVSLGHPDKTADYISEYILDRLIEQDPKTRYGLEVQVKDNYVTLGGEITTNVKKLKYKKWVKEAIEKIGYTHEYAKKWGKNNCLDASKVKVATHISKQSHDIAIGVDEDKNQGWGDQGQFWGYSSNAPLFKNMGFGYYVAKMLAQSLYNEALHSNHFGLDIKTQVTTDDTDTIVRKIVVAIPTLRDKQVTETFVKEVICDVQNAYVGEILGSDDDAYRIDDFENIELIVNGTGAYVTHSSIGDCGTTGRKLAVDFYGGDCIIGGMVCSDGGCVYPGDIAKAYGAGADFVMLGGMLAGSKEAAGELVEVDGKQYKQFYGMSSQLAQEKHFGGMNSYRTSEGREKLIPYTGSVNNTMKDILGSLRSTMTYIGATKLKDIPKCATFYKVNRQLNTVFENMKDIQK